MARMSDECRHMGDTMQTIFLLTDVDLTSEINNRARGTDREQWPNRAKDMQKQAKSIIHKYSTQRKFRNY